MGLEFVSRMCKEALSLSVLLCNGTIVFFLPGFCSIYIQLFLLPFHVSQKWNLESEVGELGVFFFSDYLFGIIITKL